LKVCSDAYRPSVDSNKEDTMDSVIYLVGLIVVVMAILSLLGLR